MALIGRSQTPAAEGRWRMYICQCRVSRFTRVWHTNVKFHVTMSFKKVGVKVPEGVNADDQEGSWIIASLL